MAEARGEEDGEQEEEEDAETPPPPPAGTLSPGGSGDPLQPTVLDLQDFHEDETPEYGAGSPPIKLALARLCEDENKRQPLNHDVPIAGDVGSIYRFQERSPSHHGWQTPSSSQKKDPGEIVNELFKEAKERGAIPVDEALEECSKMKSFSGGGYKLGDSDQGRSEYVFGEYPQEFAEDVLYSQHQLRHQIPEKSFQLNPPHQRTLGPVIALKKIPRCDEKNPGCYPETRAQILLKLWKNGFSLDDGDLRPYTEEANTEFLDCIKRGEIPSELRRMVHGDLVHLDMEDHQDQEYVRPRLRFKAFSGEGQKLGSLTPEIISTPSSPEEERKVFFNAAVVVDEFEPTTRIQIRLADGSRLIQRFNLTHRIVDIRHFITESRPAFAVVDFVLVTTFPNKELMDENLTLQEADVLNTVILQRLK